MGVEARYVEARYKEGIIDAILIGCRVASNCGTYLRAYFWRADAQLRLSHDHESAAVFGNQHLTRHVGRTFTRHLHLAKP